MKKPNLIPAMLTLLILFLMGAAGGCGETPADRKEQEKVQKQQGVYVENQPVPYFDWSLQRQLLIECYKAQNEAHTVWYFVMKPGNLDPIGMGTCVGMPLAADTQLTNPLQIDRSGGGSAGVIEQAEPNGLFSSKSTHATLVMRLNNDGSVSPLRFESEVDSYTVPVRWDYVHHCAEIIEGSKPSFTISTKRPEKSK